MTASRYRLERILRVLRVLRFAECASKVRRFIGSKVRASGERFLRGLKVLASKDNR